MKFIFAAAIIILTLTGCFQKETPQPPLQIEVRECVTVCEGNVIRRNFSDYAFLEYCLEVNKPMCTDWRDRAREIYTDPLMDFVIDSFYDEEIIWAN
jgi:hypothetical protein